MQALFAHALLQLGGTITEVNQIGHPDIKWVANNRALLFQVKSMSHNYVGGNLMISHTDVAGICPSRTDEDGYFAVLDCAAPVSWVVINYDAVRRHEGGSVSIETVRASADPELSNRTTEIFGELVMRHRDNLHLLTFRVLRNRALRGDLL